MPIAIANIARITRSARRVSTPTDRRTFFMQLTDDPVQSDRTEASTSTSAPVTSTGATDRLPDTPVGCRSVNPVKLIVIPGTPRQKGNSKSIVKFGSRMALIGDARTREAEANAKGVAWAQRPPELLSSKDAPHALVADVDFVFPIPPSRRTGKRALKAGALHAQRPDRGNLLKLIEDVLQDIAYADDCVVADGRVRKIWGDVGETRVMLRVADEA